jgi:hypothetical protein
LALLHSKWANPSLTEKSWINASKGRRRLRKISGAEDWGLVILGEESYQIVLGKKSEFNEETFERFTPFLLHALHTSQVLGRHFAGCQ